MEEERRLPPSSASARAPEASERVLSIVQEERTPPPSSTFANANDAAARRRAKALGSG